MSLRLGNSMFHLSADLSLRTFCSAMGAGGMDYLLARLNISSSYKTGSKVLGNTSRARPICLPKEELYELGSLPLYITSG